MPVLVYINELTCESATVQFMGGYYLMEYTHISGSLKVMKTTLRPENWGWKFCCEL